MEVIAEWLGEYEPTRTPPKAEASDLLAALRSAGFQVFKPENAIPVYVASRLSGSFARCEPDDADGFVVPADSGGSG